MRRTAEGSTIAVDLPVPWKALKGFSLFSGVHESALRELLRHGRLIRARAGETVWPTARRREVVALIAGWARLQATDAEGEQALLRILGPGDLGGPALHGAGGSAPYALQALGECEAVAWKAEAWGQAQRRSPRMAWNVIQAQTEYILELQRRWIDLTGVQVEARLARALLRLARAAGRRTPRGTEIQIPITREDLAGLIGATIHTVSRTLCQWERAGWVVSGWRRAIVVDVPSLRQVLGTAEDD